ncbi:MAG TPA: hypothetical protein VJS37_01805 [Terriglobales bacterium]|jgi:hypothetical protein|nr:hypothetical protein [Terriglobales bacterium]
MSSPKILLALWIAQTIIEVVLATILYCRKLHKDFPAFFLWIVVQVPVFCVQFPIYLYGLPRAYFYVYWTSTAVDLVLAFKIIYEIFLDVFKPYHALKDLGHALFKWAAVVTVLVSVVLVAVSPTWNDPILNSILVVQRCIRVVQCGLVIFLLAFCRTLGVNWRRFSFGIALGFGLMAASELVTLALFSGGRIRGPVMQSYEIIVYNAGLLLWVVYALLNRRRDLVPVLVPQRWDEALADIQPVSSEADSLIPMFEHMVDQALSKRDKAHA